MTQLWLDHGTKFLGTLGTIIPGLMAIPELIPASHQKYWVAANLIVGAWTVKRGFDNSKRAQNVQG